VAEAESEGPVVKGERGGWSKRGEGEGEEEEREEGEERRKSDSFQATTQEGVSNQVQGAGRM